MSSVSTTIFGTLLYCLLHAVQGGDLYKRVSTGVFCILFCHIGYLDVNTYIC